LKPFFEEKNKQITGKIPIRSITSVTHG